MLNTNKFVLGILTILLAVSFASALQVSPTTINLNVYNGSSNSTIFTINSTDSESANVTLSSNVAGVTFSSSQNNFLVNSSNNASVILTFTASSSASGTKSGQILINGTAVADVTINVLQNISAPTSTFNFCGTKAEGDNLSISDFSIDNNGEGEENEWYYLDDIEISVDIKNKGDKRVSDVYVQLAVYKDGEDVTDDFDLDDDKISLGSIADDDEETAVFKINKISVDLEEGDYDIYVKAYSSSECVSETDDFQITNPFGEGVIAANGVIDSVVEVSAGTVLDQVEMELFNLGSDKEEEVLVNIYNKELGINQNYHLSDLRSGDSELIYFPALDIPTNAVSKTYNVQVTTFFSYDDGDVNEESSYDSNSYDDLEDDYNSFSFTIKVINGQAIVDPTRPTIIAKLDTDALVGKPMNVTVSIKNNGLANMVSIVSVQDYDTWAKLGSVTPSTLIVSRGSNGTVVLTFTPTKEGEQTFKINLLYDGKTVSQDVVVNVSKKTGFLSSVFGQANATSYLIAGIIVLVVLIVIVLLVKLILSRRS